MSTNVFSADRAFHDDPFPSDDWPCQTLRDGSTSVLKSVIHNSMQNHWNEVQPAKKLCRQLEKARERVSPQISDSRIFPIMSALSSKHTLSRRSITSVRILRLSKIWGEIGLRMQRNLSYRRDGDSSSEILECRPPNIGKNVEKQHSPLRRFLPRRCLENFKIYKTKSSQSDAT